MEKKLNSYMKPMSQTATAIKYAPYGALVMFVVIVASAILIMMVSFAAVKALYVIPAVSTALAIGTFGLTRKDPVLYFVACTIFLLPIVGLGVPPRAFEISVFNVFSSFAAFGMLLRASSYLRHADFKESLFILLAALLLLPSVLKSVDHRHAAITVLGICCVYPVLVGFLSFIRQSDGGYQRLNRWIAVALILVAASIVFERITKINLSFTSLNHNAMGENGIYRAGGFFQDPQKAAQFASCFGIYFFVLLLRGAIKDDFVKKLAMLAFFSAFMIHVATVSRAAMLSFAFTGLVAVALVSGRSFAVRMAAAAVAVLVVVAFLFFSKEIIDLLPTSIGARLKHLGEGSAVRLQIWAESWRIFRKAPWFGIGPGDYQENLMQDNPLLRMSHMAGGYVPDQPESGYLKILYEVGIYGVVIALAVFARFAIGIRRCIVRGGSARDAGFAVAFTLIVFAMSFTTLFTVSDPRNLLILVILGAIILAFERAPTLKT